MSRILGKMDIKIVLFITYATTVAKVIVICPCNETSYDSENRNKLSHILSETYEDEDAQMLKETVKKYGPPRPLNHLNCTLPGPEILTGKYRDKLRNVFLGDKTGNYTIKIRARVDDFSYNDRYEIGEMSRDELVVKGQFSELVERGNGRFYLCTLGYVRDQNGYSLFLIDFSKIATTEIYYARNAKFGTECGTSCRVLPWPGTGNLPCKQCASVEECDKEPPDTCVFNENRNDCGRRVCAKGPGETCGGSLNVLGTCGEGLWCSNKNRCHGCYISTMECYPEEL